ncbi:MAG: LacI family DNA-binding transcriptional regulator [Eubacteriales bacterium]
MNSSDIARLAGVSRSTVSRVLNNYDDIPEKTRKKVERVIQKYGYVPNASGQMLAGQSNHILGFFVADLVENDDNFTLCRSDVFTDLLGYAADIARNLHYNILISILTNHNTDELDRLLMGKSVSGAIIIGDTMDQAKLDLLADRGCKLCLHNQRPKSNHPNIINVNVGNYHFGYEAAKELLENGHRRIAMVTGTFQKYTVMERYRGFLAALDEYGIEFDDAHLLAIGEFHRTFGAYDATRELLERNADNPPTAIIVANSPMLPGVVQALTECGMRIPQDISVIGVGGSIYPAITSPPVTNLYHDISRIASVMVSKLIELVEMGQLDQNNFLLPECNLVRRDSIRNLNCQ